MDREETRNCTYQDVQDELNQGWFWVGQNVSHCCKNFADRKLRSIEDRSRRIADKSMTYQIELGHIYSLRLRFTSLNTVLKLGIEQSSHFKRCKTE